MILEWEEHIAVDWLGEMSALVAVAATRAAVERMAEAASMNSLV